MDLGEVTVMPRRRRLGRAALAPVFVALVLIVWLARPAAAQLAPTLNAGEQEQVTFGMHVVSVHGLDFFKGTYEVSLWAWWIFTAEEYQPHKQIEIVNADSYQIEAVVERTLEDGSRYVAAKFVGTMRQLWDLHYFPFDIQKLRIVIESAGLRSNQLQFFPDLENSTIGRDVRLDGWKIRGLNVFSDNYLYKTTFGVPTAVPASYPRIAAEIVIERRSIALFFSVFIGYFIAFLVTSLTYFVDVLPLQARINMLMGSIFASIGNKYVIDTNYPPPDTFSLAEKVGIATFGLIAVAFVVTVISARLVVSGRKPLAERINVVVVRITVPAYAALVGFAIFTAITRG